MLTYDQALEEVTGTSNADGMATRAMLYEYRTTGELSVPRAQAIVQIFWRRGLAVEEAAGRRPFRELNGVVHLMHEMIKFGPERLFGEQGKYADLAHTPGYVRKDVN